MSRRVVVGLGAAVALLVAGLAWGASEKSLPTNPVAGAQIFIDKGCVLCHAIRGEGGSVGPDLGRVELNHSLLEVAGIMWSHSPRMNEKLKELRAIRPSFTPKEMGDLIGFLYFLNYFGQAGDPKVGETLFGAKGCKGCHQLGGEGGQVGPPLDSYKQYVSPIFIAQALWNHGPKMKVAMEKHGVKRPKFSGNDLDHIMAYIQADSTAVVERRYMEPGNPQGGMVLFEAKGCLGCHSIRGRGGTVGPDLGEIDRLRGSLTQIAGSMWNHAPNMWAAMRERNIQPPKLTLKEMNDLVTYLYFLQYMDEPGDAKTGRALFLEKGCVNCHSLTGREEGKIHLGGKKTRAALTSPIAVVTAMWNHASQMEMVAEARRIAWPHFRGREMADIVAYILSGVGQPPEGP